jgi:hypothetical protein
MVDPVASVREPLTPELPAEALLTLKDPLDEDDEEPLDNDTEPPVSPLFVVVPPATSCT